MCNVEINIDMFRLAYGKQIQWQNKNLSFSFVIREVAFIPTSNVFHLSAVKPDTSFVAMTPEQFNELVTTKKAVGTVYSTKDSTGSRCFSLMVDVPYSPFGFGEDGDTIVPVKPSVTQVSNRF